MIPSDKIGHMVAGSAWAAVGSAIWLVCLQLKLTTVGALPLALFLPPLTAGVTKEFADWTDNRTAQAEGKAPMHGVEFLDAAATALPGIVLSAIAIYLLPAIAMALNGPEG